MQHSYLRRLAAETYSGLAMVHWSMAVEERKLGWLNSAHHSHVRELLLHTCARYDLLCPAYCLMPDHGHFLLVGTAVNSDQQRAVAYFRRHWNRALRTRDFGLQLQPFDHVLRDEERVQDAFGTIVNYIVENPVRAEITPDWRTYLFLGAIIPGRPDLDPRNESFIERFWRHWNTRVEAGSMAQEAE